MHLFCSYWQCSMYILSGRCYIILIVLSLPFDEQLAVVHCPLELFVGAPGLTTHIHSLQ